MRILDQAILYRAERFHAAFPSIVRFSDDSLLLAFRRARDGLWLIPQEKREGLDPFHRMDHIDSRSHLCLVSLSADGRQPMGELELLPMDPEAGDQDASLLVLPDDELFVASFSWYPLPADAAAHVAGRVPPGESYPGCRFLFWGSHASLRGREPGGWRYHHRYLLPDGGYGGQLIEGKQMVGASRGRALFYQNEILMPVYGGPHEGSAIFASSDRGSNWCFHSLIAKDPEAHINYQEPALCEDGQGGIRCFMRTAGADGRLASAHSPDGVHWENPKLHQLVGHPFHPLPLADGRLLLTYGYREPPYGIRARLLDSPLDDPDDSPEIVLRDDGLCADLGYPWSVALADGRVLTVYYLTDEAGIRHIAGSWLDV